MSTKKKKKAFFFLIKCSEQSDHPKLNPKFNVLEKLGAMDFCTGCSASQGSLLAPKDDKLKTICAEHP